jgi:hypothetical protein
VSQETVRSLFDLKMNTETEPVTKRTDPFDGLQKTLGALAGLITALTTAAWTGHSIGWW